MTESQTCQDCGGTGQTEPKPVFVSYGDMEGGVEHTTECWACHGRGYRVPDWERRGRACKERRIHAGILLADLARRMGTTASDISAQEHGRADPAPLERYWEGSNG